MADGQRQPHPLLELTRVRLLEFWREPGALFWVFVFPVLLAVGLGIAFRHKPPEKIRVAVVRGDPGAAGVAAALKRSDEIELRQLSATAAAGALRTGRVDLVVRSSAASRGRPAVVYRYDAQRAEGRVARLVVDAVLQRAAGRQDAISAREQRSSEVGARYIDFLLPGLIGLNVMGSSMWGLGFVVVNARQRKLLKRFVATPMRRSHYLLSFMLSRLLLLFCEVALLVGFGWWVFDVAVRGSLLALALISLLGGFCFTAVGILVAARPRSTEAVSGWMNFVQLPMWLLSGSFFSYERFPELIHPAIRLLPLTALNDALRAVINEGQALWTTAPQLLTMALWALLSFALGLRIFRWR